MNLQAIFASLALLFSGTMCEQADARPPQVRQEAGRGSMGHSTWHLPNAANIKKYRRAAEQRNLSMKIRHLFVEISVVTQPFPCRFQLPLPVC